MIDFEKLKQSDGGRHLLHMAGQLLGIKMLLQPWWSEVSFFFDCKMTNMSLRLDPSINTEPMISPSLLLTCTSSSSSSSSSAAASTSVVSSSSSSSSNWL
ncbi:hypothetical protein Q3G72_025438 [Acer saccharum]|nr:hypothetical protein Q3G72_025438 [Acer saccharum]